MKLFIISYTLSSLAFQVSPFATYPKSFIPKSKTSLSSSTNDESQLSQLSKLTTLSIDSGDLNIIQKYADTGYITDATTNPLFVSQVGLSENNEDDRYSAMVNDAISYAIEKKEDDDDDEKEIVGLAIDRLAVNLGKSISEIVTGYISTEVDPRLSFDTEASIERGRRIIEMYKALGVPKERILIKLAATWEGIQAAETLQKEGISCNLTLIFSFIQAVACAQRGVTLISPFPGRVLDWNNAKLNRPNGVETTPSLDEGVQVVTKMYNYYKCFGHDTICMPASWRPSRGAGYELDEIRALAGTDRMTIPPALLETLEQCKDVLPQCLSPEKALSSGVEEMELVDELKFRYELNMDGCGTDKLAEGIRAFIGETEKLEDVLLDKIRKRL